MPIALTSPPDDPRMLLARTEIFHGLPDTALGEVATTLEWLHVGAGETLFRQGDLGDAMYVVCTGRVRITVRDDTGRETVIREAGRGENVGELALLTGERRSGTARAVRDSCLVRLPRGAFDLLAARHPDVALAMMRVLATWVQRSNLPREAGKLTAIAVVGLGSDVHVGTFCEDLALALQREGRTIVIDERAVDAALFPGAARVPDGDARSAQVAGWLSQCETAHRFVVYRGEVASAGWTRRCLRQADRVLALAKASTDPHASSTLLNDGLAALYPDDVVEELVLLHEASVARPRATDAWLGLRPFSAHHHVKQGDRSSIERVARHLAGTSIGVVLSGGGARGFAHIGVIDALLEAGISIDRIGGTSMGAVIAAQYASGCDVHAMLELNRTWQRNNPLWDLTLPVLSLVSGRSGVRILDEMFGDRRIEDLWLDYFCCSTNLSRSRLEVHRDGPLARWVRASISIPGIAPPLRTSDGDLLVDGGVLNNMPADVMARLGGGRTIAVDVAVASDLSMAPHAGDLPSPWRRLGALLGLAPGRARADASIFSILERTTLVASLALSQQLSGEVDLYLRPPVERFGIFEWAALEPLVETGRRHAREQLAQWRAASDERS